MKFFKLVVCDGTDTDRCGYIVHAASCNTLRVEYEVCNALLSTCKHEIVDEIRELPYYEKVVYLLYN